MTSVRFAVLVRDSGPSGGRCPACGAPMDEFGCRLVRPLVNPGLEGIAGALEVECRGTAAQRIQECPLCR